MRKAIAASLSTLLLALASPAAFAQSPASVIYACVGTSGTLQIVPSGTECKKNESLLSWNVGGPSGPPGPRGPSNAFVADNSAAGSVGVSTDASSPTPVVALKLPPGNYVLNAVVGLSAQIAPGTLVPFVDVACRYADGTAPFGPNFRTLVGGKSTSFASIPLIAARTLPAADIVTVACAAEGGIAVSTQPSLVIAVQVESLSAP